MARKGAIQSLSDAFEVLSALSDTVARAASDGNMSTEDKETCVRAMGAISRFLVPPPKQERKSDPPPPRPSNPLDTFRKVTNGHNVMV